MEESEKDEKETGKSYFLDQLSLQYISNVSRKGILYTTPRPILSHLKSESLGVLGSLSEKKTGLCGKNSQTGGGGLTQTHFLMSTYQVIFGMPK